jgi:AraC-like DNA-binding protein
VKPRLLCVGDRGPNREEFEPLPQVVAIEAQPPETGTKVAIEKHYSPAQVAERLGLSDTKVRRMFQNVPGVLKVGEPSRRLGRKLKRRYYTLRIPESVALKVIARMRNR